MSTRIRLRRMGAKKRPFYRVVVADQRSPRDGRFIENIGKYHPLEDPSLIEIDEERALHWLRVGAQPSDQVRNLMVKVGIWEKFVAERPAVAAQVKVREAKAETPKLSKKAAAKAAAATEEEASAPAPTEQAAPAATEEPAAEPPVSSRRGSRGFQGRGLGGVAVKELVEFLARGLVDDPDSVAVSESVDDRGLLVTLHVAPDDMGKVIGRGGRTAKAIRAVVRAAATRQGTNAYVDIAD